MIIRFRKLVPDAVMPIRGSAQAAGYDLTAVDYEWDGKHKVLVYHTGIAVEIPRGYAGFVFPRSSIYRKSLVQTNCVGVIDCDYRGEILVKFALRFKSTDTDQPLLYDIGERIAQLVIMPVVSPVDYFEAQELSKTERGEGGYGSTGL